MKENVNNVSNLGHRAEFSTHGVRPSNDRQNKAPAAHQGNAEMTTSDLSQEVTCHG